VLAPPHDLLQPAAFILGQPACPHWLSHRHHLTLNSDLVAIEGEAQQ
jgi:hypothetical protein